MPMKSLVTILASQHKDYITLLNQLRDLQDQHKHSDPPLQLTSVNQVGDLCKQLHTILSASEFERSSVKDVISTLTLLVKLIPSKIPPTFLSDQLMAELADTLLAMMDFLEDKFTDTEAIEYLVNKVLQKVQDICQVNQKRKGKGKRIDGKDLCGEHFIPQILQYMVLFWTSTSLKTTRMLASTLLDLVTKSQKNQELLRKEFCSEAYNALYEVILRQVGDFCVQADIMEIFYRLAKTNKLDEDFLVKVFGEAALEQFQDLVEKPVKQLNLQQEMRSLVMQFNACHSPAFLQSVQIHKIEIVNCKLKIKLARGQWGDISRTHFTVHVHILEEGEEEEQDLPVDQIDLFYDQLTKVDKHQLETGQIVVQFCLAQIPKVLYQSGTKKQVDDTFWMKIVIQNQDWEKFEIFLISYVDLFTKQQSQELQKKQLEKNEGFERKGFPGTFEDDNNKISTGLLEINQCGEQNLELVGILNEKEINQLLYENQDVQDQARKESSISKGAREDNDNQKILDMLQNPQMSPRIQEYMEQIMELENMPEDPFMIASDLKHCTYPAANVENITYQGTIARPFTDPQVFEVSEEESECAETMEICVQKMTGSKKKICNQINIQNFPKQGNEALQSKKKPQEENSQLDQYKQKKQKKDKGHPRKNKNENTMNILSKTERGETQEAKKKQINNNSYLYDKNLLSDEENRDLNLLSDNEFTEDIDALSPSLITHLDSFQFSKDPLLKPFKKSSENIQEMMVVTSSILNKPATIPGEGLSLVQSNMNKIASLKRKNGSKDEKVVKLGLPSKRSKVERKKYIVQVEQNKVDDEQVLTTPEGLKSCTPFLFKKHGNLQLEKEKHSTQLDEHIQDLANEAKENVDMRNDGTVQDLMQRIFQAMQNKQVDARKKQREIVSQTQQVIEEQVEHVRQKYLAEISQLEKVHSAEMETIKENLEKQIGAIQQSRQTYLEEITGHWQNYKQIVDHAERFESGIGKMMLQKKEEAEKDLNILKISLEDLINTAKIKVKNTKCKDKKVENLVKVLQELT